MAIDDINKIAVTALNLSKIIELANKKLDEQMAGIPPVEG